MAQFVSMCIHFWLFEGLLLVFVLFCVDVSLFSPLFRVRTAKGSEALSNFASSFFILFLLLIGPHFGPLAVSMSHVGFCVIFLSLGQVYMSIVLSRL